MPQSTETYTITPISPEDNPAVNALVIDVLTEHGCVGEGFAYNDPEIKFMYDYYQGEENAQYWVIKNTDTATGTVKILGGGGYARLKGTTKEDGICELQKLYFYAEARGKGFGRKLLELVIDEAKKDGYKEMYLETVPQMQSAQGLYFKFGFKNLDCHKGATGHHEKCTVRMSLQLAE